MTITIVPFVANAGLLRTMWDTQLCWDPLWGWRRPKEELSAKVLAGLFVLQLMTAVGWEEACRGWTSLDRINFIISPMIWFLRASVIPISLKPINCPKDISALRGTALPFTVVQRLEKASQWGFLVSNIFLFLVLLPRWVWSERENYVTLDFKLNWSKTLTSLVNQSILNVWLIKKSDLQLANVIASQYNKTSTMRENTN